MAKNFSLYCLIAMLILSLSMVEVNSACTSEKTYPLLYGDASQDVVMNDLTMFSDGSIVFAGMSKTSQTANGEGFIFGIDKYGKETFKKLYTSGTQDTVNKVAQSTTNIFAVGTSGSSGSYTYFGLKLDTSGTQAKNVKIGANTTAIPQDSEIVAMQAISDTVIHTVFKGSGTNVFISIYSMDTADEETLVGFTGAQANSIPIRVSALATAGEYVYISLNAKKLWTFFQDTADTTNNQAHQLDTTDFSVSAHLQATDSDSVGGTSVWIVLAQDANNANLNAYHVDASAAITASTAPFSVTAAASVTALKAKYIDATGVFILAMQGTTGSVIKVTGAGGTIATVNRKVTGLSGSMFVGDSDGTDIVFGGSDTGLYNSGTGIQTVIWKGTAAFDFSTYNCYDITATDSLTAADASPTESDETANNATLGTWDATTPGTSGGGGTLGSNITTVLLRPAATQDDGSSNTCKLQAPDAISIAAQTLTATSGASDTANLASATQCQGWTSFTWAATVSSAAVPWAVAGTDSLVLKPSLVTNQTHCCGSATTLDVTVSDTTDAPNSVTGTVSVTFNNADPTVSTGISDVTLYQGQDAHTIDASSTFTDSDSDTLTLTVSSNETSGLPATVSGTTITLTPSASFTGIAQITVTATDFVENTVTDTFDVTVSACTQTNCATCSGTGATECLTCDSGYTISSGACVEDSGSGGSSSSASGYLNRDIQDADDRAGVGTSVAAVSAAAIGVSVATAAAPVITGSAVGQTQVTQIMCMFNMNIPNEYVEYCQSYSVTKLDFKFVDFIELQDSMETGTRRNLDAVGYKNLSNIRIYNGSFLVNYIYWLLLLIILILVHLAVIGILNMKCTKEREDKLSKCLKATRSAFEFAVYFYLLIFASMFMFLCIMNEIASGNFDTGLLGFSYFVSLFSLIFLLALMAFPVLMIFKERSNKEAIEPEETDEPQQKTAVQKLWRNFTYGIRPNMFAKLFYSVMLLKFFCYSLIFVLIDGPEAQIVLFILLTCAIIAYLALIRPFNYLIQNILIIVNECVVLLIAFMMIGFIDDGSPKDGLADAVIVILSLDIILSFIIGIGFQIYLLYKKHSGQGTGKVATEPKKKEARPTPQPTDNIDNENPRDETAQNMKRNDYGGGDDDNHLPGINEHRSKEEAKDESFGIKESAKKEEEDPLKTDKKEDSKQNESANQSRVEALPPLTNAKTVEQDSKEES